MVICYISRTLLILPSLDVSDPVCYRVVSVSSVFTAVMRI